MTWSDSNNVVLPRAFANAKVIYLKPTDAVLIGNVGHIGDADTIAKALTELQAALAPNKVFVFAGDIDVQLLSAEDRP